MSPGKSRMARKAGGWMKAAAGLAVLAGTALWSGCDKSMESMARQSLAAVLVSDDLVSSGSLDRPAIFDVVKPLSGLETARCLAQARLDANPKSIED